MVSRASDSHKRYTFCSVNAGRRGKPLAADVAVVYTSKFNCIA